MSTQGARATEDDRATGDDRATRGGRAARNGARRPVRDLAGTLSDLYRSRGLLLGLVATLVGSRATGG